jgi:hypothetical protein
MSNAQQNRRKRPQRRRILVAVAAVILSGGFWIAGKAPRADRDWTQDVSRQPTALVRSDGTVAITDIRDWDYDETGPTRRAWRDGTYDPDRLVALWFNLDPFPDWDGVAHTYLVFEFAAGTPQRYLGISVEARKQRGETYSGLKGLFRQYELLHVWASESDLVKRRGLYLGEDVYQYRLELAPEQVRAVFSAFIQQTQALAERPRFYNTLLSNCTNELARTIRRTGGEIPRHYSFYLTGFADSYLHRLGYIVPAGGDFAEIRKAALRNQLIRSHAGRDGAAFSDAIRRLR